jgi:hypothetical protein
MTPKKEKPKEETMEWQYERCKRHLEKVYETKNNVFMRCKKGHVVNDVEEHPVFMVSKVEASKP